MSYGGPGARPGGSRLVRTTKTTKTTGIPSGPNTMSSETRQYSAPTRTLYQSTVKSSTSETSMASIREPAKKQLKPPGSFGYSSRTVTTTTPSGTNIVTETVRNEPARRSIPQTSRLAPPSSKMMTTTVKRTTPSGTNITTTTSKRTIQPPSTTPAPKTLHAIPARSELSRGIPAPSNYGAVRKTPQPPSSQQGLPVRQGIPRGTSLPRPGGIPLSRERSTLGAGSATTMGSTGTVGRSMQKISKTSIQMGAGKKVTKTTTDTVLKQPASSMKRDASQQMRFLPRPKESKPKRKDIRGEEADADLEELEREVEKELLEKAAKSPDKPYKATGTRSKVTSPKIIMTDHGPVEAKTAVYSTKSVIKSPEHGEILGRHIVGIQNVSPGKALMSEVDIHRMSPQSKKDKKEQLAHEAVRVRSSVLSAPGIKQVTTTTVYETDHEQPREKQHIPDPEEIAKLIEEENADIENSMHMPIPDLKTSRPATYGIRRNVEVAQLEPDSLTNLQENVLPDLPSPDEEQEEPSPEVIAGMLNTEERGLKMGEQPSNVYEFLFSDEKIEPTVEVNSASPPPLQDIVVPLDLPNLGKEHAMGTEVLQVSVAAIGAGFEEKVTEDSYTETVGKEPITPVNTARKGSPPKIKRWGSWVHLEAPPWALRGFENVVNLVGAVPAGTLSSQQRSCSIPDPVEDGIEYMLHMEPPNHCSRVQLRGSQKPSWFPGYILALPEIPDLVKVVKSPSNVITAAWRATQPDIFPDDSMFII